jgi:hypothetical protein
MSGINIREQRQQLIDEPLCYLCHIESILKPATAIVCVDGEQQRSVCARHASSLDGSSEGDDRGIDDTH